MDNIFAHNILLKGVSYMMTYLVKGPDFEHTAPPYFYPINDRFGVFMAEKGNHVKNISYNLNVYFI